MSALNKLSDTQILEIANRYRGEVPFEKGALGFARTLLQAADPACQWVAHIKQDGDSEYNFEASVCWGKPGASWGWFGPTKLRLEMSGDLAVCKWRAEQIAAALNAAGYDPTMEPKE